MLVLEGRSVRQLYHVAMSALLARGEQEESRAGPVTVMPTPVTLFNSNPRDRVLLDPQRDANPFFHVAETLWMLAGRDDAALLNIFVRDFGERFAEMDGPMVGRIHGAYGRRWRSHFGGDQLQWAVERLRDDPHDRRIVIQMFDHHIDFGRDLRDVPCNLVATLRVRAGALDMLVTQRSGDLVWGVCGANAVHFSYMQEYMADRIHVKVGRLWQVVNNLHAYNEELRRRVPLSNVDIESEIEAHQLGAAEKNFDEELSVVLSWVEEGGTLSPILKSDWLRNVAAPMMRAHAHWRQGDRHAALDTAPYIGDHGWRRACHEWMQRRINKREEK